MAKTILFVGSASQGIKTVTDIFPYVPLSLGMHVSSSQFYESSPRKGAMGGDIVLNYDCQDYSVNFLVALSQEGINYVKKRINKNTIILFDNKEVNLESLDISPKKTIGLNFKEISQSRYTNTVSMGALLKLLGIKEETKSQLEKILKKRFKGDISEIMRGFEAIKEPASDILDFKNKKEIKRKNSYYLSGNEAAVFGALSAGANFFGGYPITPSSEALHTWSQISPLIENVGFLQGSSEENAIGAVLGANVSGGKGWSATSGPGLDRMLEQLGWAAASKTPFVIYNVQRGGPSTGLATLTQTSDLFTAIYGSHGDYPIFVLTPSTAQETYELMKLAFKLSWSYGIGTIVNSSKEAAQRKNIVKLDFSKFDKQNFSSEELKVGHRTGSTCGENNLPSNKAAIWWLNDRFRNFEKDYDCLCMAEFINIKVENKKNPYNRRNWSYKKFKKSKFDVTKIHECPEEVLICYGESVPPVKKICKNKGVIALKSVYPYPIHLIKQLNNLRVKKICVIENNRGVNVHNEQGQLAHKINQYFNGEVRSINKWDGFPFYPDQLKELL